MHMNRLFAKGRRAADKDSCIFVVHCPASQGGQQAATPCPGMSKTEPLIIQTTLFCSDPGFFAYPSCSVVLLSINLFCTGGML